MRADAAVDPECVLEYVAHESDLKGFLLGTCLVHADRIHPQEALFVVILHL